MPSIATSRGAYLDAEGRRILDAISSWWVVTHGHRHPAIVDGNPRRRRTLDQIIFAGFTHEPAERPGQALSPRARRPRSGVLFRQRLDRVEVALKMALGYFLQHRRAALAASSPWSTAIMATPSAR